MDQEQFIMALGVGMNTAAEVARRAGYGQAADVINEYERDWTSKARPKYPRDMVRGDIYAPKAGRWATADDFGLPPKGEPQ